MQSCETAPLIAIACGGTGGHLFPGLAVAEVMRRRGCAVSLLISPKEVDQQAVKTAAGMEIITLPAVGLNRRRPIRFLRGFWGSYRAARKSFRQRRPQAVLAMGGFTSAPPILAGGRLGAATFLHESNSIPGRANRWLAPRVTSVFVGFPSAAKRLRNQNVAVTGTPVRSQFRPSDTAACRARLGLAPDVPTLLVMGGSQGAAAINHLVSQAVPLLSAGRERLQFIHLTGADDLEKVRAAYATGGRPAFVRPFFAEMDVALGAATVAISRAGASSLAELAAMRLPAVLIPYPAAADNHQFHNARAYVETGAARMLVQRDASPQLLVEMILDLAENNARREAMVEALNRWNRPGVAEQMAAHILTALVERGVRIHLASSDTSLVERPARVSDTARIRRLQIA